MASMFAPGQTFERFPVDRNLPELLRFPLEGGQLLGVALVVVGVDEHDRGFESQLELGVENLLQLVCVVLLGHASVGSLLFRS